jgi:hypothetical protein
MAKPPLAIAVHIGEMTLVEIGKGIGVRLGATNECVFAGVAFFRLIYRR